MADVDPTGPAPDLTDDLIDALAARGMAEPVIDGRRLRAERGRAAVVAATLELVDRGAVPTFGEIARRSGVSERTIFRYFPDREALLGAVVAEVYPGIAHCLALDAPDGDLAERAGRLVALRLDLAERTAGLARSVERLAPTSHLAATVVSLRNDRLHDQVARWFRPELDCLDPDDATAAAAVLDVLLAGPGVQRLQEVLGRDRAAQELVATVARLLVRR